MNQNSIEIRDLDLSFGPVKVLKGLNINIAQGEFIVLLGSSGCGKSTLLNCIAGLLEPTEGQIFINGENVTWLEPSERGIGMVFQSYALYPQMNVEANLSFGLKNQKVPKDEIKKRITWAAEILQLTPLLKRKPAALSGGQRQRVAIGRALVRKVDVFLFDEPLSNLDAKLRADLRVELKRLHQKLKNTMVYVTHDQIEALTLADRIAIMKDGQIMQLGTPDEIYHQPQNLYVADFIGSPSINLIQGELSHSDNMFNAESIQVPIDGYNFTNKQENVTDVTLGIRPEDILTGENASQSIVQAEVKIDLVEKMGADTVVYAHLGDKAINIRMDGKTPISSGQTLKIGFNPPNASLFDTQSGIRL